MCAPRYVHSCVCMHMRRPEDNPGCHFQKCHPSPSRRGLLLAWNSSTRLGWVATKAPSTIFSLPPNLPLPQCRNKSSLRSYKPSASLGLRHPLGSLAIFFLLLLLRQAIHGLLWKFQRPHENKWGAGFHWHTHEKFGIFPMTAVLGDSQDTLLLSCKHRTQST